MSGRILDACPALFDKGAAALTALFDSGMLWGAKGLTMETVHSINLIVSNPDVRGGRPAIIGTGVTVEDVAIAMIYHGQDADGIAGWYDLTLAQVHAALAYYYEHKSEIDANVRERRRTADELKEKLGGGRDTLLPR